MPIQDEASWTLAFDRRKVSIPLNSASLWLDWDIALSIAGHDQEVKKTYQFFLKSEQPPEVFLDIGANYGTHSLLFLVSGIRTISFEPNVHCHQYFRDLCAHNGVSANLETVALGNLSGSLVLRYPEGETWLGSTSSYQSVHGEQSRGFVEHEVQQRKLDDYLAEMVNRRVLIKIDTEGNELAVLEGAVETIRLAKPYILFEALDRDSRVKLSDFFERVGYRVFALPWSKNDGSMSLESEGFFSSTATNFIASP